MMTDRQVTASIFLLRQQVASMERQLTTMAVTSKNLYDQTKHPTDEQAQVVHLHAIINAMLRAARGQ
jgi:hypothetical protein